MARSSTRPASGSGPAADAPAADGAARIAVLVVTADDALWTHVTGALPALDARQFDSAAELIEGWNAARPAVVLVDAKIAGGIGPTVERILTHGGAMVPVALADDAHQGAAAALERKRALFDHVRLPIDAGTATTVIERSTEEAHARLLLTSGDAGLGAGTPSKRARGLPLRLIIIGVLVLVAAGAAVYFGTKSTPTASDGSAAVPRALPAPSAAPVSNAPATAGVSPEEVEGLLERARTAMRDKRYVEPSSDNALNHYKSVLDVDPTNGEAKQGLDRITDVLIGRAAVGLSSHDYSAALRALEIARSLRPDNPRLAALDAQLGERMHDLSLTQIQAALQANAFTRAATLMQQAERSGSITPAQLQQLKQDSARREAAAEVSNVARLVQARIAQGKLLEPADDSAKHYLKQLQEHGGVDADELARLNDSYLRRMTVETRAAMARGQWSETESWIAELKASGVAAAQIASLQNEADRAREKSKLGDSQRLVQLVKDRTAARRLTAPDDDSALRYYRQLNGADAKNAALPGLRDALLAALLEQLKGGGDGQAAQDAAKELGASAAQIAAAQGAQAANAAIVASPPQLQRALSLDYPARAQADNIEGWVDVEFEVSAKGTVTNAHVLAAQPAAAFDHAAINAINRAHFTPAKTSNGTPVTATTRMRIRFALQGAK